MFTVLIAEKGHIDAIQKENKLFFEPFLRNKELAICRWDTTEQNLSGSVPDLSDAVGRRKEWRAVVINNVTEDSVKTQNPFDTVDDEKRKELKSAKDPKESSRLKTEIYEEALKNPLQKLATWLCFKPEYYIFDDVRVSETRKKQDVNDWAVEQIGRNNDGKTEMLELDLSKREMRKKEELRREFVDKKYLDISYPTEIYCISVRTAENNFFDPDTYWNTKHENEYSAFADYNMYFDKMRFMAFDLYPKSHKGYRNDYVRFLSSVLVFATNPVPGSAMKARRLYRLDAECDETAMFTLITSYDKKLAATSDVIDNEMRKIRGSAPGKLSDRAAETMFLSPKDVAVLFDDSCEPEKVIAKKDYGLFFDSPENEFVKWNKDCGESKNALGNIIRKQARTVSKSAKRTRFSCEIDDIEVNRLTPFQIDDIREYTNAEENAMTQSSLSDFSDMSKYTAKLDAASENVKKVINRRMTARTYFALAAVCLGLFLLCFFPFLFANGGTAKTVTTAIILSVSMLGMMAVIMAVTLIFLRLPLKKAVKAYNKVAGDILKEINASMKGFSEYLRAYCNVRRGYSVQKYAEKNLDEYTKSLIIRKKHKDDIRKQRACLAEGYGDFLGDVSVCDEAMARPYDYDFDRKTSYSYPVPFLTGDCRQIEFINVGNFVTVPSGYIRRIIVQMEEIYEK